MALLSVIVRSFKYKPFVLNSGALLSGYHSTVFRTSLVQTPSMIGRRCMTYMLAKGIKYQDLMKKQAALKATSQEKQSIETKAEESNQHVEDFYHQIRALGKTQSVRKILQLVSQKAGENALNLDMTLFTAKTLSSPQMCNRTELIREPVKAFLKQTNSLDHLHGNHEMTIALAKWLCRTGDPDDFMIADSIGTILMKSCTNNIQLSRDKGEMVNDLMWNLAVGHASHGDFKNIIQKLELIKSITTSVYDDFSQQTVEMPLVRKVLKALLKECPDEHLVLSSIHILQSINLLTRDFETFQLMSGNFFRKIDFVKGAVSISTLPMPAAGQRILPEFVFLGRSNVGKSSLINMLTNRKQLAYTSKVPGKTSEFNYFHAQGSVGRIGGSSTRVKDESDELSTKQGKNKLDFYLVDVPGVGYATKSKSQRMEWVNLLNNYVQKREGLKTVFHLVDSRHGLLDADYECLSLLKSLPQNVKYTIVFTKVDKLGPSATKKAILDGKTEISDLLLFSTKTDKESWPVSDNILLTLKDEVLKHCDEETNRKIPVVFCSSESRVGGVDLLMSIVHSSL